MRENVTYELEDKDGCPNCHHQVSLWLGFSGVDNDGVHLAYRCPQCGFETCDFTPDVDDVVPDRIAWRREPDGVITWYSIERAEQNAHLTPESLASSQAVSNASALSKSDGDTPPAQAQVA